MLYIQKREEPKFLIDFKKKYPKKDYDSNEFAEYRPKLRKKLVEEQRGICAYCCGRITEESSHNEHIEPRHPGKYTSQRFLEYTNIVASCNNTETCGTIKKSFYDENKFVSPLNRQCEEKFTYYVDGRIAGDDYTIDLLNLNAYELKNARKAVIRSLQYLDKDTIQECYMNEETQEYPPYYNVIKWFWKTCKGI